MHTHVRDQIIKDQYSTLTRIISKIVSVSRPTKLNLQDEESFIRFLWPFPQPLHQQVISKIVDNNDLRSVYLPLYDKALLYHMQSRIFQAAKLGVKIERLEASEIDKTAPDTLGWRGWNWDNEEKLLVSPSMGTKWIGPDLRVEKWVDHDELRGIAGIHARRIPKNWKIAYWGGFDAPNSQITGIVERFGKFVLGELGWRAEWVIIRKLLAPTQEIGFALEMAYPEIHVEYFDIKKYGDYNGYR